MASVIDRKPLLDPSSYYAEAQSWRADVVDNLRRSRRRAWSVAGVASAIAGLATTAVVLLTPLKTTVPYVIELERSTGYVQAARVADPGTLADDEAVRQSSLYHYVLARESIDAADIAENYERTLAWSGGAARHSYLSLWDKSNPHGLIGRYPIGTNVSVAIKGISPLSPNSALVRFATTSRDANGRAGATAHWQAVIGYRFADRPLSQPARFLNPLGFTVLSYRRDADLAVEPSPAVTAAASAPIAGDAS